MPCLKMVASLSLPTSPHPHTSPLIVPRREPEPESGHTGHCSSSLTELLSKVCKNSQNLAFTRARVWLGQTINCQGWDWGYFPPTEFKNIFNLMTRCFRYEWVWVSLVLGNTTLKVAILQRQSRLNWVSWRQNSICSWQYSQSAKH